jgi:hypothetical protein
VFDRVEMDVIDVARKIGVIVDCMFPEPPLTQASMVNG